MKRSKRRRSMVLRIADASIYNGDEDMKNEFVQFSCALHPDHVAWLRSKKDDGYNMSALVRQALDEFIEKYSPIMELQDEDDDFCDPCGGGQGYHDLVELPMEGSPEAEALAEMVHKNMAIAAQDQDHNDDDNDNDNKDDEKSPF